MGKETVEIKDFIKQINKKFSPEKIILFGSRAKGYYLKDSDYDIIVVSKKFKNIPFLKRLYLVHKFWKYKYNLDILAYTPEEFEKKKKEIGIVKEAVEKGIEIS
jgi:hypothetical protein